MSSSSAARAATTTAASNASQNSSLSCFGALFSVLRAATDYCRYGNLRQYLLIDPNTGEPRQTFYERSSAGQSALTATNSKRTSGQSGNASNGSEYILPPEIRAEIVAAAKRGKLQQYLQLRKHR